VLIKSRRALAASVLALTAAGGGSVAVIRAVTSPSSTLVAPSALPSAAGPAATAAVPRGAGNADGAGSGSAGGTAPAGQPEPTTAPAVSNPASAAAQALPRSAGQGDLGPLPAGALPADGAVPGASPSIQALAAARASTTALPHSPQLLAQLAGPAGSGSASSAPTESSPAPSSPATSPAAPATSSGSVAASPTTSPSPSTSSSPAATASPDGAAGVSAADVSAAGAVVPAAARTLTGLDVAAFQHPVTGQYPDGQAIAWTSVAAAGYKFTAVKSTEGDYYVNPWAATDLAKAKAAGLDVTPYEFAVPNVSGGAPQARFAVEYSGYKPGARVLPLMLDIEYDPYNSTDHTNECYGLTKAQMIGWLGGFVGQTRSLTGQYPIIYTTANWWASCTGGYTGFSADPMWVAAYGVSRPPLPGGWHAWTFWQYTANGTVPGVNAAGTTDLDHFSPGAVGLINPGAQSARTGATVSLKVGSLGSLAGESLSYTAAGLPPGLSVHAGGAITGKVASSAAAKAAVTYRVTVSAKNTAGATATAVFSWKVTAA
jgi:GH25 family lysozyme M1 (1,4-beta-N-acetylmuramidase)